MKTPALSKQKVAKTQWPKIKSWKLAVKLKSSLCYTRVSPEARVVPCHSLPPLTPLCRPCAAPGSSLDAPVPPLTPLCEGVGISRKVRGASEN